MTTSPTSSSTPWVLKATITTARAADARWQEQLDALRPIATYNPDSQAWRVQGSGCV
jgi:hypothetical protein